MGELLPQQEEGQEGSDEGRGGIQSAGLGGAQVLLGPDVGEDAQAVCHEAQSKSCRDKAEGRQFLSQHQCRHEGAAPGENALHGHDLVCALPGDPAGAVVLKSPAACGSQNEERAHGKGPLAASVEGQDHAGEGDEQDPCPKAPRDLLLEQHKGDHRSCSDLEIPQQRGAGGGAVGHPNHQQDRRYDVQQDHTQSEGQVLPRQAFLRLFLSPAEEGHQAYPKAGS